MLQAIIYRRILLTLSLTLLFILNCFAQKDTIKLQETIITETRIASLYSETSRVVQVINREEILKAPVQSINELLEYALNVDVRNRGSNSVQSDIGIRGGSFEQTLVLLNGIKINDPQTGHHTMNIPVELSDVERIEILEGPGSRIYGVNAFAGAINIITSTQKANLLKLNLTGGQNKTYNTNAAISYNKNKFHNYLSITKKASDGYTNNTDYSIGNIFYQADNTTLTGKATLQLGYTNKKFGANEFYSSKYPNEFEQTKTLFANIAYATSGRLQLKPSIYYRRNQDRFELFRSNPPSWYTGHNYHLTNVYGAEMIASLYSGFGKTTIGTEFRSENILSNVLGDSLSSPKEVPGEPGAYFYTGKSRQNIGMFAEHFYYLNNFAISAGIYENNNSDFGWNTSSSADFSYKFYNNYKVFASVCQSLRLPTFTDLYYKDVVHIANPNLKPEKATTYEIGLKYTWDRLNSHVAVFRREGTNIIDWVKPTDTSKWESRNITQVVANGFEMAVQYYFPQFISRYFLVTSVNLTYSYLSLEKQSENFISTYSLDYLKHKFTFRLNHNVYKAIKASWALHYHDRAGTYADAVTGKARDYKPFFVADFKMYYEKPKWTVYVEANNLFNEQYQDIGNILMQGRWIGGGLSYKLFY